ncbi:MAG: sulfite reductase (NADPH) hemoprotein beta-component [Gammaproteobacteria bacterium]|jgi:sulfite reductase (NADPH) hemoprotein beta-component
MYQYSVKDQQQVDHRVLEFRNQTQRYLAGDLSEEQFRPLRLMNGLYIQRHAPMLRIAIPYGVLNSRQLKLLAQLSETYDRGYGHLTTRQNIQFNWLSLPQVPDLLEELATVQMHAIQTSGNCIRNITCDHLAGIDRDEVDDPRPWCEMVRQWATVHPEFLYLPRKFKIAFTGSLEDRAAILAHDIGLRLLRNEIGETGFELFVGGGLGRTPIVGSKLKSFLPAAELLRYLEAILRVYNLHGRRDNKYKARIKILVKALGINEFKAEVEKVYSSLTDEPVINKPDNIDVIRKRFANSLPFPVTPVAQTAVAFEREEFNSWERNNTITTKHARYRAIYISLKNPARAPGDISAGEMRFIADLADRFSAGLIRTTHTQNLLLPLVHENDLLVLWRSLQAKNMSIANIASVQDIICCPGLEFCSLANTSSIPIAQEIQNRFTDKAELELLGDIQIKISGCMNACGHHHIGHIGILGVDKKGEEWFQITLGGRADRKLKLGKRLGPAVDRNSIALAVETIIRKYLSLKLNDEELFLEALDRVGIEVFREVVYG